MDVPPQAWRFLVLMPNTLQAILQALAGRTQTPQLPPSPAMFKRPVPPEFLDYLLGLLEHGNIDLFAQPEVANPAGGKSTVYSVGINFDGREHLLPQVTPDGRLLDVEGAIREFKRTGRHLGIFDTPENATSYAKQLHEDYEAGKYRRR